MNRAFSSLNLRVVSEAVLLCLLASIVGLSINYQAVYSAFSGQEISASAKRVKAETDTIKAAETSTLIDPFPVMLDEIDEFLAEGALLVDSRSKADYDGGHLAGAISFPLGQLEKLLLEFKQQTSIDRTLIVYCSGYGCPDSHALGIRLLKEGFTDVLVYEGGYPEWRDAGRPIAGGTR